MTEGPVVVLALERENAIAKWREVMGATTPPTPPKAPSVAASEPPSTVTALTAPMPRTARIEIAWFFAETELL